MSCVLWTEKLQPGSPQTQQVQNRHWSVKHRVTHSLTLLCAGWTATLNSIVFVSHQILIYMISRRFTVKVTTSQASGRCHPDIELGAVVGSRPSPLLCSSACDENKLLLLVWLHEQRSKEEKKNSNGGIKKKNQGPKIAFCSHGNHPTETEARGRHGETEEERTGA